MKTYIIYLAAGNSRRFGENKLFYLINGKPLYQYGLDELLQLVTEDSQYELIVVTQYFEIITKYPDLNYIYSSLCEKGISYSIKAGLEMIDTNQPHNIMFVVADQPRINHQTIAKMVKTFNQSNYSIASMSYQGKFGNPTIFKDCYRQELLNLSDDFGGRVIINNHLDDCLLFEVEQGDELNDIDEIKDVNDFI